MGKMEVHLPGEHTMVDVMFAMMAAQRQMAAEIQCDQLNTAILAGAHAICLSLMEQLRPSEIDRLQWIASEKLAELERKQKADGGTRT